MLLASILVCGSADGPAWAQGTQRGAGAPTDLPPLPPDPAPGTGTGAGSPSAARSAGGGVGRGGATTGGGGAVPGGAGDAANGPGPGAALVGTNPGTGSDTSTAAAVNAPTTTEAATAAAPQTNYLARFLGIENAPIKVYGWIQNSYTGNTNGRPKNDSNFSVFPNRLADSWQGNQYYIILEKTLRQDDSVNFGGRVDTLFGNDWEFTKSYGLFDRAFKPNSFNGVDLPQIFAEVHLPVLTKNGLDIRGGRFFSLAGFENVQAVKRPLLSVPYLFNYTPFTLFGMVGTLHVNERINMFAGTVNGWDRWIDQNYRYSYLGGYSYNSRDLRTSSTTIVLTGPDQLPRFEALNSPFFPTGTVTNAMLQGKFNPEYAGNWRTYLSSVLTHNYKGDKLIEAAEVFFVHETNVPGLGPGGTVNPESAWYGFAHWYIYNIAPKVQGVWRAEVFRDQNGAATGQADNYYEMTLGAPYKPKPWLWIRPEARYDWAQYHRPFNDGTRGSQLTVAFDVIIQF